jgi:hypothetical protein
MVSGIYGMCLPTTSGTTTVIGLTSPAADALPTSNTGQPIDLTAEIERRHAVAGIIHEYRRVA